MPFKKYKACKRAVPAERFAEHKKNCVKVKKQKRQKNEKKSQ